MSQTSHQTGQTVRFPRAERRGLLLGLSLPQLLLTGAALPLLGLAAFTGVGPVPGTSLALTGGILLTTSFARAEGQPAYRWVLLRGRALHRRTIGQDRFRARPERPRPAGLLGLPGAAASLKVVEPASAGFAAVHDPHARTLTAVLRVHGTAFALLDTGEQDRRVRGWGRVLAGLCQGGRIARVQVLERTVPDSGDALARYAQRHLSDPDTWQSQVYQDLVGSAGPVSEVHETYLALSLDLAKQARRIRQAGGGLRGGMHLLTQEQVNLEATLHAAGLTPNGWLDTHAITALTRTAYDPTAATPARTPDHNQQPQTWAGGPMAVDEQWDRLRSDTGFHAVYLIAQWPRVEVGAGFLDPLVFTPGIRRSLSIVAQPVGTDQALKDIRRAKTHHVTDAAQRTRIGQIEDEALAAEFRDVLAREQDLVAGHGELRFVGLLAVTAPSAEQLDAACGQVETAAVQAMVDLRRLVGQQAEAFVAAALPLGRGLR